MASFATIPSPNSRVTYFNTFISLYPFLPFCIQGVDRWLQIIRKAGRVCVSQAFCYRRSLCSSVAVSQLCSDNILFEHSSSLDFHCSLQPLWPSKYLLAHVSYLKYWLWPYSALGTERRWGPALEELTLLGGERVTHRKKTSYLIATVLSQRNM